jgi:hypothetical protein
MVKRLHWRGPERGWAASRRDPLGVDQMLEQLETEKMAFVEKEEKRFAEKWRLFSFLL